MTMTLEVPERLEGRELRAALDEVADRLVIDLSLEKA